MWLVYGVDTDHALVFVSDVPRGKTHLRCPYCAGPLTAKKGRLVGHHFAHTGETCREVARDDDAVALPLYESFNLHLSGKELGGLSVAWQQYGRHDQPAVAGPNLTWRMLQHLDAQGMLRQKTYRSYYSGGYEFTKLGKIPFGALSLALFNDIQEPLILGRLDELEQAAASAWEQQTPLLLEKLTDLRIYRAQLRRILATALYFVEVQADGETLYKIGVTTRPIEERVAEVRQHLQAHFTTVIISVLGRWPHRGNVELYFKHRYDGFRRPIGTFTEYFSFGDPAAVLRDLRRMQPKELTPAEYDVLDGKPAPIEQRIAAAEREERHKQAIRDGMQGAARKGTHIGRPTGEETPAAFLAKPSSQRVLGALDAGLSVRAAARESGVAINTVRKVAALRQQQAEGEH